jgi:nitrogen regulatory protein P-II 1
MKEIKAIIGLQRLNALHEALRAVPGFPGMTVGRAESYPCPHPRARPSIRQELTDHVGRWRIEMIVPDELTDVLYDTVVRILSSGPPGDSVVWVTEVTRASFIHKTVGDNDTAQG